MGKIIGIDLMIEPCCEDSEECSEIEHFHLAYCPACETKNAPTSYYGDPVECISRGGDFSCECCNAQFRLLSYALLDKPQAWIEIAETKN